MAPRLLLLLLLAASCARDAAPGGAGKSAAGFSSPLGEWRIGTHGEWSEVASAEPRWNLLLLTLDTTRPDRFHCYGDSDESTPNLDRLSAEGVLFERARTPVPVTLPAHTTILTGLYPFQHGVRNNGTYVAPERLRTLPELLKAEGYATGAILGAFPVDHRFGLNQGFDLYDDDFPAASVRRESDTAQRVAGDVTRLSLEWIAEQGGPFFLWAHFFDPHFPYAPPEPFASRYPTDLYQGEIAYLDSEIGRLLDGLRERALLERTIVIVVADHGESLGEHQEMTHSIFIYNSTQHVPLIVRFPNVGAFAHSSWRSQRVPDLVSQVDVLPTAWNALGLPRESLPPVAGRSLLPLIAGKSHGEEWVYHETRVPELEYGASDLRALEGPRWKYVRAPRPELYDLLKDPGETRDLSQAQPKLVAAFESELTGLLRTDTDDDGQVQMDAETIEKLKSLGYLAGVGTKRKGSGPAPDPKDMIWAYEAINQARNLAAEHRPEEALGLADSVLSRHPDDETAQRIRASCLIRLNRGAEAIAAYDSLLAGCAGCPDELALLRNRAIAALNAGQLDDASARVGALLDTHPKEPGLRLLQSQILQARGQLDAARAALDSELALDAENTTTWTSIGDLELQRGRLPEAEQAYRRALTVNPLHAPALASMSEILVRSDREAAARGLTEQALAADPTLPAALFRKAWFLSKDNKSEEALALYQAALRAEPRNTTALYNLGNLYRKTGQAGAALDAYHRAIQTGLAPLEVYINLGVTYAEMGRATEAIAIWEDGIARFPNHESLPRLRENVEKARAGRLANSRRPQ